MLTIPTGRAARTAWVNLPPHVRDTVAEHARRDEGHPDAYVAAIAVGLVRAARHPPLWRQTAAAISGSLALGVFLAFYGNVRPEAALWPLLAAAALGIVCAVMTRPGRSPLPRGAEIANLRVFLSAPAAAANGGDQARYALRITAISAAATVAAVALAAVWIRVFGLDFDLGTAVRYFAPSSVGAAVGLGLRTALELIHRPKYWARRVSVRGDGVRFGRPWILPSTPAVAKDDVVDVTLEAPAPYGRSSRGAMIWHLRDGLAIRVALRGGRTPEELILAARRRPVVATGRGGPGAVA